MPAFRKTSRQTPQQQWRDVDVKTPKCTIKICFWHFDDKSFITNQEKESHTIFETLLRTLSFDLPGFIQLFMVSEQMAQLQIMR